MSDGTTVVSDAHRDMMRQLERRGVELMEEIPFPPYRVDIYLPGPHICVEVDGPQHRERADAKRDRVLQETYLLPTFRVKAKDVNRPDKWKLGLAALIKAASPTADDRRQACALRAPWV